MTEYVTPNIHTVLKKYQTSAPKSLQGPGHSLHTSSNSSSSSTASAAIGSSSLSLTSTAVNNTNQASPQAQQINANCPCPLDVSLNNNGSVSAATSLVPDIHGLVALRNSPCDLINKTVAHCPNTINGNSVLNSNATSAQQQQQQLQHQQTSASNLSVASNCVASVNLNPALALIKKEIMSSPEPPPPPPPITHTTTSNNTNGNGHNHLSTHDLPVENSPPNILQPQPPSIKIMPPPPPEVSQPILSAADSGSGELHETRLEGKTIGCFSLGGEMRLCLPQFLNNVLAEFSLEQINRSFDDLGIFCSQCTPDQLMEFKAAKILPSDVKSSGLITRTDAERLCAILLHRSDRNSYINVEDIPKGAISFKVYHRCFGKCEGICTPDMYSYQKPTCIMCLECKGWFSPQKFVGHVHRKVENRTCHWGFDSRKWHEYLHVALDVENRDKYQKILDELKEVEIKEQQKAQHEINYLKRKAEMHMDHSLLVPSMGLGPPPPHQPLPPSVVKHRGEQLDIPSSKKVKGLDEASSYQLDYQHYQSLMYAHCAQQQRMAAAGQMSAFRPWHAAYNAAAMAALSTLPYLSQEPPVLQNPERVVRSTDRERFERTYQPNVALAPRKTHLTQEREKEQRELRERERIEREREREIERIRERERSREREREFEREREREIREREIQKKLQQQQQHQQQQIKQQPITGLCEGEIQIKQERAPTPCEMSPTPPPLSNHSDEDQRSCNGPPMENDDPPTPLVSPLALSRSKALPSTHLNHMEMQTRRLSLQNCNSSANSSTSSSSSTTSTTPTNLTSATTPPQLQQPLTPAQKLQQLHHPHHHPPPPATHHLQRIPSHLGSSGHGHRPQAYIRQSPSPHATHCNSASCHNSRSPEEFGGSNEITSSTSPLPQQQQQQQNAQTIIATVNQHNKLLPNSGTYGANNGNSSGQQQQQQQQQHNEMTGRIRISKNLINQNNIMRTPTPPQQQPPLLPSSHSHNHQHLTHSHHQHSHIGLQSQQTVATAAQSHQQQYDYFKQTQRYYHQQQQQQQQQHNHTSQPQATNLNNHHHHLQQPQPQQQPLHSPSQSSSAANTPTGLNLITNLTASSNAAATSASTNASATTSAVNLQNHDKPYSHLRTPQAFMNQHQHAHHLTNGGRGAINSEFELSTDTDDESVNDGEADSSNTLTPWDLAIETLRDSRPKDRERLLNMLQRILNENQHYRLQNQQLKELIEVRNEQIAKLQAELQHCQRQLENLQISPMPTAPSNTTLGSINGNGLITKALRKECDDHMMLRVPLKKSQRREPEMYEQQVFREKTLKESDTERAQRQCEERIQYNLTQIKRELSESMEEDEGDEEAERSMDESSQPNVESSTQLEYSQLGRRHAANNNVATSESESEDEDHGTDQRMSSTQNQNRSHSDADDYNVAEDKIKAKNQKDSPDSQQSVSQECQHENHIKREPSNDANGNENDNDEAEDDEVDDDDAENGDDNDDDEQHHNHKRVQALHTNALSTPPTATTPLSPDSAATAGQLFDSSNSSDESSMKKAQMSASHALAKMNSETNDDENDDDEDIEHSRNSNASNLNVKQQQMNSNRQSDNEDDDDDTQSHSGQSENDNSELDEDQDQQQDHIHKSSKNFKTNKVTSSSSASMASASPARVSMLNINNSNNNTSINQTTTTTTPLNTTTVVLATKASKKLTPTTNNDIKIK